MDDINIGFLIFPDLTQLDFTGPFEVFSHMPGAKLHVIAKTMDPVFSDKGLQFQPTADYESCPKLDIICVPGGVGHLGLMEDKATHAFLQDQAKTARFVTSVCTGSLVLAAAGLLKGYKATSHWAFKHLLADYDAIPTDGRVVHDRDRYTGGGVTAGIDFALTIIADIAGKDIAKLIQLGLEYNPQPPFDCGSPDAADEDILKVATQLRRRLYREVYTL